MTSHPFTLHLQKGGNIILFDSECILCNRALQFILKRDRNDCFMVASLHSQLTRSYLEYKNYHTNDLMNSVILLDGKNILTESTAILKIAKCLPYWRFLYCLRLVPGWMRDPIYRYVANNRYKWSGKTEKCMVPLPEIKAKLFD